MSYGKPKPIPLCTNADAGTGFLVTDGKTTWLTTCVHLLTGLVVSKPDSLPDIAIKTVFIPETNIAIPVAYPFEVEGRQRFAVVTQFPSEELADAVTIRLTQAESALLRDYGAYDLLDLVAPNAGDEVWITGFPGLGARLGSLQAVGSPQTAIMEIEMVHGSSIVTSSTLATGYSGSAMSVGGKLCGIMTGSPLEFPDKGHAVNLSVIKQSLFV